MIYSLIINYCNIIIDPATNIVVVKVNLNVSDIGLDWVYLTWNESVGNLVRNNETYLNSDEMNNKTSMNISLETGISYNCFILDDSLSESMVLKNNHVNFTLGKKDQLCTLPINTPVEKLAVFELNYYTDVMLISDDHMHILN